MLRHQRTVHKAEMTLECGTCRITFDTYPSLVKHCSAHNHVAVDPFGHRSSVTSSINNQAPSRSSSHQGAFHPYALSKNNSDNNSQISKLSDYIITPALHQSTSSMNDFLNFGNLSMERQPSLELPLFGKCNSFFNLQQMNQTFLDRYQSLMDPKRAVERVTLWPDIHQYLLQTC